MRRPSHNDWEPGRIPGGKKIIDDIKNWIRSCIKEINMANENDTAFRLQDWKDISNCRKMMIMKAGLNQLMMVFM